MFISENIYLFTIGCSLRKAGKQSGMYGGPQLPHQNKMLASNSNHSHQIQITHIKFKSLTSNSNHSQQIQITHSKLKITHSKFKLLIANYKSTTANYKSFTSNTNRSHEIQIAHSKYKSLTASTNTVSVKRGLRTADCRLRTADCRPGEKAD